MFRVQKNSKCCSSGEFRYQDFAAAKMTHKMGRLNGPLRCSHPSIHITRENLFPTEFRVLMDRNQLLGQH